MFTKISVKRPVSTVMVLFIVLLCGLVALSALKLNLMPNVDLPMAFVSTTYVGAGPDEVETLITKPIEEALGTVNHVKTISSTSSSGSSMVQVEFEDGTNIDMAAVDMREKIDQIKDQLPDDAQAPQVLKININDEMSSTFIGVTSAMDMSKLTDLLNNHIINNLERLDGVAAINLYAGSEKEVQVILNPEKMQGYGVTTQQISGSLQAENLNLPAGKIKQGDTNLQIRAVGQFTSVDEIANLPITTSGGALIHLRDVAQVKETVKDEQYNVRCDGQKGIALEVRKQSNANIVDVSNRVNKELEKISKDYPNIKFTTLYETADYIQKSVKNVFSTAVQAALMAMVVLLLFLHSAKSSLIIGVSIPTSVIATFGMMYLSGMTLNIISLGGITLGIGMLVDNSVVVLEAISRHFKEGKDATTAALDGAKEVAMSVVASTLTTVAVFVPLMFVSGIYGQMFKNLSLSITFSLMASLVVSLTFVPMACARLFKREQQEVKKNWLHRFLDMWARGLDAMDRGYGKILRWSLVHKKRVVAIIILVFFGSIALVPIIGLDLMPSSDEGNASIQIEMPKGSVLEKTNQMVDTVTQKLGTIPETKSWYVMTAISSMGASSSDSSTIGFNFVDKKDRKRSTDEIAADMRKKLAGIAGAKITVSSSSSAMGSYSSSYDVQFELRGDEMKTLRSISTDLVKKISEQSWVSNAESSLSDPVPEAAVMVDRTKSSTYGITNSAIANAVSTAITGSTPTHYKVDGNEIDVRIMQEKDRIQYVDDLENITVMSSSGAAIPLSEIATVKIQDSADKITRENQQRYITIGANLNEGIDAGTAQKGLQKILDSYNFPDGYSYKFSGTLDSMQTTFTSFILALLVAILLVYMIMASQFESFLYPFIIMFSLPIALTGGVLGLFVTRNTITAAAFMGFITLVGTVVNNAIVLVDYTNQLRKEGMKCDDALMKAGPIRLRPILMTTLTTVIGLIPTAMVSAEGTEMQQPMAITIIFGLSLSTIVTLIFIPVLYSGVEKFRHLRRKKKRQAQEAKQLEQASPSV